MKNEIMGKWKPNHATQVGHYRDMVLALRAIGAAGILGWRSVAS